MSDGFSPAFANALLNVINGTAPTAFDGGTVFAQIHTGDPGNAGTSNISVGQSTREAVTFGAAANTGNVSTIAATSTPTFTNGGTTETLTDVSYWTAATAGSFIASEPLSASESWSSGNTFELASASISLPTAS
jgi:hypothetical protein